VIRSDQKWERMNGEEKKRQKSQRDEKKGMQLSPPTREKKGHKEDKRTQ
jgi:hypothetical protein